MTDFPSLPRAIAIARAALAGGSGPDVAWLFHRLLALVFLGAWISLGVQAHLLIGSRGLLPIARYLEAARDTDAIGFGRFPTLFWLAAGDGALTVGIVAGVALALLALAGVFPRLSFALGTALYLSYVTACRTFLSFQWDNLLLECGALAALLPADKPALVPHALLRLLLFKLYFESGIAKWQSHLGDWHDGSAMTFYYETAPLPTWLGFYAHALPDAWHRLESWGALALELAVPILFFGPRRTRLAAATAVTLFQIVNAATANYGFFCYLAAALHVFLLDDADVGRLRARLAQAARARREATSPGAPSTPKLFGLGGEVRRPSPPVRNPYGQSGAPPEPRAPAPDPPWRRPVRAGVHAVAAALFVCISLTDGLLSFAPVPALHQALGPWHAMYSPWRLVNTYHLFGHITRERIEPEFQTSEGQTWTPQPLRHKPGDLARAPDLVAPHQPRVDFQLWFYGLSFQARTPEYVATLLDRLCRDPDAVQDLFARPLAARPGSVRIAFWQYHFATPAERRATGLWWRRDFVGATPPVPCR